LYQLGINLTNSLYRTAFVRENLLNFSTASQIGEWIPFVGVALAKAKTITLIKDTLVSIRWWHGFGLTQQTLGGPKRSYSALQSLKSNLQESTSYELFERSYVNFAISWMAAEINAQRKFVSFTEDAKFLRLIGFDALGILGHQQEYYYDHKAQAVIKNLVMGDVYYQKERQLRNVRSAKTKLAATNATLRTRIDRYQATIKRLRNRKPRTVRKVASSLVSRLKKTLLSKNPEILDTAGDFNPGSYTMNYSTGRRFIALCECLLELTPDCLQTARFNLRDAILEEKTKIKEFRIYAQVAISQSNKVYQLYLDKLALILMNSNAAEMHVSVRDLMAEATSQTAEKITIVFNIQESQVFPTVESVHLAASKDYRVNTAIVFAPIGDQNHNLKNLDSDLHNSEGSLCPFSRDEYLMFEESPDILVVTRPYFNAVSKVNTPKEEDIFEIPDYRTCGFKTVYIPYAFYDSISEFALKQGYQHTIQPASWKIVAFSLQILDNYRKYADLGDKNVALLGAPRFDISSGINPYKTDEDTHRFENIIAGRRTLLWNPHFGHIKNEAIREQYLAYFYHTIAYFENHQEL
ncbi:MAG: hypothetical protein EZS28_041642, partial [Streblomastix strix]